MPAGKRMPRVEYFCAIRLAKITKGLHGPAAGSAEAPKQRAGVKSPEVWRNFATIWQATEECAAIGSDHPVCIIVTDQVLDFEALLEADSRLGSP